jgi:protoheme IX farnesyltransferase
LRFLQAFFGRIKAYLILTKPSIMLLVIITGAAGLVLEGSLNSQPLRFGAALLLLAMAGGSANAFNQFFERERDAVMERTRKRRPLPNGSVNSVEAFVVASSLGLGSVVFYALYFNTLASLLSAGTILFYALFYTIYLKPRTSQNIVIGGAAGAMAPVIGWAAAAGSLDVIPILLFLIIFLWTPPHFWALALCLKEDYKKVGLPMLPLLVGDAATWKLILIYVLFTIVISLAPLFFGVGILYGLVAAGLGWVFLRRTLKARSSGTIKAAWGVFGYSIVYLLALFTALMADKGIGW